jgi:hypothetical protein
MWNKRRASTFEKCTVKLTFTAIKKCMALMTNGNASIHHMYLLYTALGCGSTPTTEGAVVLPALTIPPEITQQANQGSQ